MVLYVLLYLHLYCPGQGHSVRGLPLLLGIDAFRINLVCALVCLVYVGEGSGDGREGSGPEFSLFGGLGCCVSTLVLTCVWTPVGPGLHTG